MICEFNSHHHVPKKEYREHLKTCAENLATQKAVQTLHTANVKISGISDIMSGVHLVGGGDDDWDDDNYAAYDPTSKMAETPMILPQGLTPATSSLGQNLKQIVLRQYYHTVKNLDSSYPPILR